MRVAGQEKPLVKEPNSLSGLKAFSAVSASTSCSIKVTTFP